MRNIILLFVFLFCAVSITSADSYYHQQEQSSTNLGAGAVYTSSVYAVDLYESMNVNVESDVDSATDGLKINFFYTDGDCSDFTPTSSNMDYTANGSGWTYSASSKQSFQASVRGNCAWVTYTNGASPQTTFKLTIFGTDK